MEMKNRTRRDLHPQLNYGVDISIKTTTGEKVLFIPCSSEVDAYFLNKSLRGTESLDGLPIIANRITVR